MEWHGETRLQLLLASNDSAQVKSVISILHANGIQTVQDVTSPAWRSAGFESLIMVSTEDYPRASTLCAEFDLGC
jgi:hypothetical protein